MPLAATMSKDSFAAQPSRERKSFWSSDAAVYLLLAVLVLAAWRFSRLGLFKAGDDVGYWVGVAGAVIMLLLLTYPLRKHFRFAQNWGRMKWWFWLHMALGIGGPLLILVHSTFRIHSLNAAVALYSMIIVALSGIVGRFIYRHVNRGLRGEEIGLQDLQKFAGMHKDSARSSLSFASAVEARLKAFEQAQLGAKAGWGTYFSNAFWLPVQRWIAYRECAASLHQTLMSLAQENGWSADDLLKRREQALKLIRSYLDAVVGVAQFTAYERLFALWHVAHIPFVYLMILSTIVHVVAVHAY